MTAASGYLSVQSQNNSAKSVDVFLKRESSVETKIAHCTNEYELTDVIFNTFEGIPYINESVLFAYVYHRAYKHGIPIDASCEALLLPSTKEAIIKKGVTLNSIRVELNKNYTGD